MNSDSPFDSTATGSVTQHSLDRERWELLRQLEEWLEVPMLVLGFAWLAILLVELTSGIGPLLDFASLAIWAIFILDFAIKFILAPRKLAYLRRNWLTAISLVVPALRAVRIVALVRLLRTTQAVRGLRLLRVLSSTNRGMRALRASMGRRGAGYVVALTTLVTFVGAAAMYAFERGAGAGFETFGVTLWWTAMIMTTMGSQHWPQTAEGRVVAFLLSLYALGVLGYVTASLATFFLGRDAAERVAAERVDAETLAALQAELRSLRAELQALRVEQPGEQEA
jgi:voltage-gated potassium channel